MFFWCYVSFKTTYVICEAIYMHVRNNTITTNQRTEFTKPGKRQMGERKYWGNDSVNT